HHSHFYNALGIRNIYTGTYRRVDGSLLAGPSLADLVAAKNPALDKAVQAQVTTSVAPMQALVDSAESATPPQKFDQLIAEGNDAGHARVQAAIRQLVALTRQVEAAANAIGIDNLSPDTADHAF